MKRYLILILLSFQGLSQVQFETKVSKTTLGLNERLRVDFAMNIDGDNFNQPSLRGLGLLLAQSASESVWVNGKVVLKRYTLIILYPIKRKFYNQAGHH
jgi:hypothetical protein